MGRPALDEFANFFTIDLLRATLRMDFTNNAVKPMRMSRLMVIEADVC